MSLVRINELRKKRGLTIDELSSMSGVPVSTVKKITAGITSNPSLDTVKAIVYAMGFRLDDLDDSPSPERTTPDEKVMLEQYRSLDAHGKKAVTSILNVEAQRMADIDKNAEYLPAPDGSGFIRVDDEETLRKLYSEVEQAISEAESKDSDTGVG